MWQKVLQPEPENKSVKIHSADSDQQDVSVSSNWSIKTTI